MGRENRQAEYAAGTHTHTHTHIHTHKSIRVQKILSTGTIKIMNNDDDLLLQTIHTTITNTIFNSRYLEVLSRQCSGLKAKTYHNHLGWLQNETFIGPTGTASCPFSEAETKEKSNSLANYKTEKCSAGK